VKHLLTTAFLLCSIACLGQSAAPAQNLDIPKGLKQYFVGFLMRTAKTDSVSKEDQQTQLRQHLAYIRSQVEAGKYRLAGPFLDNGTIAGILIIDTATIEEAKEIIGKDPLVLNGRATPEVHPAMLADVSCVQIQYEKNQK
jgi:uncharacterized protein YciI